METSFRFAPRLRALLRRKAPKPCLEWACENVIVPDGPLKGQPYDPTVQPYSRIFLEEMDSGRWDRFAATGPSQQGKSFSFYIIPVLYHCLEIGETVVAGLPTLEMANDKWTEDFLPAIEASPKLAALLPLSGPGSRGGKVRTRVKFRNGATLRFMSAGGNDKTRAAFTARVLAATEVDGYDSAGAGSREADKLKQMEARQRAFLKVGLRTYLECTVSTTKGRIWSEYVGSTQSRLARPCPHCRAYVTPEREHLVGWEDAESELDARANAAFACPACGECWTEEERLDANQRTVLVHKGQEADKSGRVTGPPPATRTLGFRFTSADSSFVTAADIAADEWQAHREHDRENSEKEMRQFVWAVPYDPPDVELTPLDPDAVTQRTTALKKGVVPNDCIGVAVAVDTGKRELHFVADAVLESGGARFVDYAKCEVEAAKFGTKNGLLKALRSLKANYFDVGWRSEDGRVFRPLQVWIDAHWHEHTDAVYEFCIEANKELKRKPGSEIYRPSIGYGEGQRTIGRYQAPKKTTDEVRYIGRGFHFTWHPRASSMLVHMNSDYWKSELHQRLAMPASEPLAVTLYAGADKNEHRDFAHHITAEKQVEKWVQGRGEVVVWERVHRANHYLDAGYGSLAGAAFIWEAIAGRKNKKARGAPAQQSNPRLLERPGGWLQGMQ